MIIKVGKNHGNFIHIYTKNPSKVNPSVFLINVLYQLLIHKNILLIIRYVLRLWKYFISVSPLNYCMTLWCVWKWFSHILRRKLFRKNYCAWKMCLSVFFLTCVWNWNILSELLGNYKKYKLNVGSITENCQYFA